MEKTGEQIYEEFTAQLREWASNGSIPSAGNQDIRYGLTLQNERMEKYGVRMEYELKSRDGRQDSVATGTFSNDKYTNQVACKAYRREVSYYKENKKCLALKDDELLYTIITWLNNSEAQTACCCPNCGAISEVSELLEGCPYCHTKFLMTDLFPKVTNFYTFRSYNLGEKEANRRIKKWMICGGAAAMIFVLPDRIMDMVHGSFFFPMFHLLFLGAFGAVLGYFALSLSLFFRVLKDAVIQTPMFVGQMGAKKKLNAFMMRYDPGFSFEFFLGKVQALIKILIFTDDWSRLSIYEGPEMETDPDLGTIVDSQYGGAISLNGCRVEGDYCYLDLNVHMIDVYCRGSRLTEKQDRFRVGLCRNIRRPVDYGFSVKMVGCKRCGASFDASMEKKCPYCGSSYDLKEEDWVVTFLKKIR